MKGEEDSDIRFTQIGQTPDINRGTSAGSTKSDIWKPCGMHLIPQEIIHELGAAFKVGAEKYAPGNWEINGFPVSRLTDALYRHLGAFLAGEDQVPDQPKEHHLGAVMWCAGVMLTQIRRGQDHLDDRIPTLRSKGMVP